MNPRSKEVAPPPLTRAEIDTWMTRVNVQTLPLSEAVRIYRELQEIFK